MNRSLIICEKPSAARAIAQVLGSHEKNDGYLEGGGYLISWCIGHLVELAGAERYDEKYAKWSTADLPITPYPWQYTIPESKRRQFDVLRALMNRADVETVINGCDAGREGQLIFRLVYRQAGCVKPVQRLWISSMTESAIRQGFANLLPDSKYDNLYESALCRAKADWLVGFNASRLYSTLYRQTLPIGRVQTPTLAMVVERDKAIESFQPVTNYTVSLDCNGFTANSEDFALQAEAEAIRADCDRKDAVVSSVEQVEKAVRPPKIFDLTTLQRIANRLHGFTAKQTLDIAQSLYERKLITYPRSDSRYITEDMGPEIPALVGTVCRLLPQAGELSAVQVDGLIDNSKVSDHHGILPTPEVADLDMESLPTPEKCILTLIASQLLCAVGAPHVFAATTAKIACGDHTFIARGKAILSHGWKETEQRFRGDYKDTQSKEDAPEDSPLPTLNEGDIINNVAATIREKVSKSPRPYSEDTLLSAMERAGAAEAARGEKPERTGLGTPATRAGVVERLVKSGYISREKRQLRATEKGRNIIAVLPDTLKSPALTSDWEHRLALIAKGESAPKDFDGDIVTMVGRLVSSASAPTAEALALFVPPREVVGKCPRCGAGVFEGKKGYFCENRENCRFVIWKNERFFANKRMSVTKKIVADLLQKGRVFLTGIFSSKTGKTYDADVLLDDTGTYVNFKLDFQRGKGEKKS